MRGDLEVQAEQERAAIADLRALATSPIRLPPVDLLTEHVFQLRALTESTDVQSAGVVLRSYFKGGIITMTPSRSATARRTSPGPNSSPSFS